MRNRFSWDLSDKFLIRFVNEAYYFVKTFGVVESRLDFDFVLRDDSIIRLSNLLNWEDRNDFYQFSHSLSYLFKWDKDKAIGAHIVARGDDQFKTTYTDYHFFLQYRQKIHRDWLFLELRPEVHLPKENDFNPNFSFSARVEFLFGNY